MVAVGLYFDLRNPPPWQQEWSRLYAFTLEACEEAERLGLHSVWFSEHHGFEDGYLTQPLTMMAAAAGRTRRLRIGSAVVVAPFRSAVHVAEEAVVVDLISDGRVEVGLGAGYRVPEFALFGADMAARYDTTDAQARTLRSLWSRGSLSPPPVQDRIPLWMGYQGPRGARRAGLLGEGLLSIDPALVEPYQLGLSEGGHDPASGRMAGRLSAYVCEDPDADWEVVSRHLAYQLDSYRRYAVDGTGAELPAPIDPERLRRRGLTPGNLGILCAEPSVVAAELLSMVDGTPVDTVFLWASIAGMDEPTTIRHLRSVAAMAALVQ